MLGTYALLPDNQSTLEERITLLQKNLPGLIASRVQAVMIIGSVARGKARDDSDLDLLLVLSKGTPRRVDYLWWDEQVAPKLEISSEFFPIQPLFIGRESLSTSDSDLRDTIREGIPLWDPQQLFKNSP